MLNTGEGAHYFAIQVRVGFEKKFISLAKRLHQDLSDSLLWPRRSLRIRRRGEWQDSLAPLFPGYIFLHADRIDVPSWYALRALPGFIRFLPANDRIAPLDQRDQSTLTHFLSFGEVVDKSLAIFDENRRIRIVAGPLRGLEGRIIKVDRRKGRARVRLEMYQDSFEIDFGFQALESSEGAKPGTPK